MARFDDFATPLLIFEEGAAPATPASGEVVLYAKTDGSLYQKDDAGTETGLAGGGGGGITHTYLGYNTIGGSVEASTTARTYVKKVTVSTAGLLSAVSFYTKANAQATPNIRAGIWSDNSNAPGLLVCQGSVQIVMAEGASSTRSPRWLHIPMGFYAATGDYWIGISVSSAVQDLYKDGSGTDRYWTTGGDAFGLTDGGQYSITTTTDRYSIRASLVT